MTKKDQQVEQEVNQGLVAELMSQVSQLRQALSSLGVSLPGESSADKQHDFIEFGSPQHAAFLGLITVDENEAPPGRIVYVSPTTGASYYLEDQITPFMHYPDPMQVAELVLQQKVSEFESGGPKVPANAPPMFRP